jgi:DNA repair exonuclease SbcCD nuclease subunit
VIVDTAIAEKVDLVLFAGDAYKDRTPAPTFQREWGQRIMRLSRADIPVLLLVGNHDLAPTLGRAHALETFETLEVPHVKVLARELYPSRSIWITDAAHCHSLGIQSGIDGIPQPECNGSLSGL